MKKHQGPSEALNEWKKLIDQFAHDLASPLSFLEQYVLWHSKHARDSPENEDNLDEIAMRCLQKFRTLLEEMRNHARLSEMAFGVADYAETIGSVIKEMKFNAAGRGVEVSYAGPDRLIGFFDRNKVERALTNLCKNALESMASSQGSITVSLINNDSSVWIEVTDDGSGMSPETAGKVFERGFTKGKKQGTGLGLDFCRCVAEAHGGNVRVYSEERRGTVFSLEFPIIATIKVANVGQNGDGDAIEAVLLSGSQVRQHELLERLKAQYDALELSSRDFQTSGAKDHDPTLDPM